MVLDFTTAELLHSTDLWYFERDVVDYAIDLAVLGAIDHARELINILLAAGPISPGGFEQGASVLRLAWSQTGELPSKWPEGLQSLQILEEIRQAYEGAWGDIPEAQRTYDTQGLQVCLNEKSGPMWKKGERLIKAMDTALRVNPPLEASDKKDSSGDIKLSDLNDPTSDVVRQVASQWQQGKIRGNNLALAEKLWPFYARGVLLEAMGMTKMQVKTRGSMLVAAVRQRLKHPYAKTMMDDKTINDLLEIGNYNTLNRCGPGQMAWTSSVVTKDEPRSDTLLRPPANREDIAVTEERLGIKLPADYKEFLQITNGLGDHGYGLHNGIFPDLPLFGLDDLAWADGSECSIDLIEVGTLWYEITAQEKWKAENGDAWDMTSDLPQLDRYLVIGKQDVDLLILIPPQDIKRVRDAYEELYNAAEGDQKHGLKRAIESFAGSMEEFENLGWCCIYWSEYSMHGHKSFKRWLEEQVWGSFSIKS